MSSSVKRKSETGLEQFFDAEAKTEISDFISGVFTHEMAA
jgi:hypothetical protein